MDGRFLKGLKVLCFPPEIPVEGIRSFDFLFEKGMGQQWWGEGRTPHYFTSTILYLELHFKSE